MTYGRTIFLLAFFTIVAGGLIARYAATNAVDGAPSPEVAAISKATLTATPRPTARPTRAVPTATSTLTPPATNTPAPVPTPRRLAVTAKPTRTPKPTATPRATATPVPSPTTGTVELVRYWVSSVSARRGQTIEVGYVINNGTGRTARIELGASLKSDRVLNWARGEIDDPVHDVVAIVRPGVTQHERFFTLPSRLHPGRYDVAWGLRNASDGARVALVEAPSALKVQG